MKIRDLWLEQHTGKVLMVTGIEPNCTEDGECKVTLHDGRYTVFTADQWADECRAELAQTGIDTEKKERKHGRNRLRKRYRI